MFYHPLRDVFKKELAVFVREIADAPLRELAIAHSDVPKHSVAAATSGRNITVGELLTQYFEGMECQYPSTVSNVVRMGDNLKVAETGEKPCVICGLPIEEEGGSGLTLGEEHDGTPRSMCYGCARSTHGATQLSFPAS